MKTLNPDDLPKYSDPGRILFRIGADVDELYGIEVLDYDVDASPFWLNESSMTDYTINQIVDLELAGTYVLEGVTGHGWKDYFGEYDEEWSFEFCRRASKSEEETGALDDLDQV